MVEWAKCKCPELRGHAAKAAWPFCFANVRLGDSDECLRMKSKSPATSTALTSSRAKAPTPHSLDRGTLHQRSGSFLYLLNLPLRLLCWLVGAGNSPQCDVEAVPRVDVSDGKREVGDVFFAEVFTKFFVNLVRDASVGNVSYSFRPG
jgi:hypothetical protein